MTKEEIARKYVPCWCDVAYTSRQLADPGCPFHSTDPEIAMDQWAEQQAIAFHDWLIESYAAIPSGFGCCYVKRGTEQIARATFTTKMLYQIFIKEISGK